MPKLKNVTADEIGEFIMAADDLGSLAANLADRMGKGYCDPVDAGWEQAHDITCAIRVLADWQSKLILRQRMDAHDAELAGLRERAG